MRKSLNLVSAVIVYALVAVGCLEDNPNKINEQTTLQSGETLTGTKWQLTAFVDVENDTRREPVFPNGFPIDNDNDNVLTLTFYKDSLAGMSFNNWQNGTYWADYSTNILRMYLATTKVGEIGDGALFLDVIFGGYKYFNFKLYPQKALHLFYNDDKEYLEFKFMGWLNENN